MIVVITTTITTGPRNEDPISPRADPLSATISATSPREIIPIPTWNASFPVHPHIFAPSPHPTTLLKMAITSRMIAKIQMLASIPPSVTLRPTLAKNTGEKIR